MPAIKTAHWRHARFSGQLGPTRARTDRRREASKTVYGRYDVKSGLSLAAVAALVTIVGLGGLARAESGGDQVLATVGDRQITESEVDAKIAGQLAAIRSQIYQFKKRAIDAIADDYLLERAAKKANLTKEEYVKREVEDKAPT